MGKPSYEILEHTADVGLKVYGRTLQELFENAARGMVALAFGSAGDSGTGMVSFSAAGSDREELLVSWLNDILYRMDAEGWTFRDFRVTRIGDEVVEGEGYGQRQESGGSRRAVPVKAVTFHQISVREIAGGWEAVVYFDI